MKSLGRLITDKRVTSSALIDHHRYFSPMPDTDSHPGRRPSFTQASEHGSDSGRDGYVPQSLDKALLGGAPQRVGTFEYRYDSDTRSWSGTVAVMHGYEPGSVRRTLEVSDDALADALVASIELINPL
jgi:hypothetical protein